jgi:hypothetical protein
MNIRFIDWCGETHLRNYGEINVEVEIQRLDGDVRSQAAILPFVAE